MTKNKAYKVLWHAHRLTHTLRVLFIYVATVAYFGDQLQVGNAVVMHELFIHDLDHNIYILCASNSYLALTRCYYMFVEFLL